jgi:catechol 2,3-dioxygenase-like lactoylglutathione lyase family enzyme
MTTLPPIGLHLVVLYSRDIETSKIFYERIGLQFQSEQHGTGPQHYSATLNGTTVEIYPRPEDEPEGRVRIGFTVVSLDRIVEELRGGGTRILVEPKPSPWGRRAVVEGPDGTRVELLEASESPSS